MSPLRRVAIPRRRQRDAVKRRSTSNPGSTAVTRAKLRTSRPAPTSTANAIASSAATIS